MPSERHFKTNCINRILHIFEALLHKKTVFFKNWPHKLSVSFLERLFRLKRLILYLAHPFFNMYIAFYKKD